MLATTITLPKVVLLGVLLGLASIPMRWRGCARGLMPLLSCALARIPGDHRADGDRRGASGRSVRETLKCCGVCRDLRRRIPLLIGSTPTTATRSPAHSRSRRSPFALTALAQEIVGAPSGSVRRQGDRTAHRRRARRARTNWPDTFRWRSQRSAHGPRPAFGADSTPRWRWRPAPTC